MAQFEPLDTPTPQGDNVIHQAFLPPPCCAHRLSLVFGAIESGCGEDYLFHLCAECRTGKGIFLDLMVCDRIEWYEQFFEETGFRPTIITDEGQLAQHFLQREPGTTRSLPKVLPAAVVAAGT